ncbi:peptidoglycan editing factor PgeF [Granulicoccus sp. GXG6511]|uniref:peptidoglycan editing factor PgeF n=1 Tax=Granulicoccus sp. GXG6511 TaxID=3381351 RepID=UPI003D7C5405
MFFFHRPPDSGDGVGLAFTDRAGGVSEGAFGPLNLGRTDVDDLAHVRENFARVGAALGVERFVTLAQVHGPDVVVLDAETIAAWGPEQHLGSEATGVPLRRADALVTDQPGTALCIRVADCLPVLFADPARGVIGAAHAGRVGLAAGVLTRTVEALRDLGARDIEAWLGPHICGDCYEVPAEMREEVAAQLPGAYAETSWGTPALDLGAAAERQLRDLDCTVERRDRCTRTSLDLHSHRRDGATAGRLGALIWRTA